MSKLLKIFKRKIPLLLVGFFVAGSFGVGDRAQANWLQDGAIAVVEVFFGTIIRLEGFVLSMFTTILKETIKYSDFVNAPAVEVGWVLVRDLSNLFFVVVLLAIALGIILRIESYSFKKMLPKILIMAVLVNFSLVIAGVIIDAAQVVMLTFVAAFDQAISQDLFSMLRIVDTTGAQGFKPGLEDAGAVTITQVFASNALAAILLFVSCFVVVVMTVVILARIIALWLLLVLAPLPYILYAFPFTKKYAQMWWDEFIKYVIVGPSIAFFLWLAFAIASQDNVSLGGFSTEKINDTVPGGGIFTDIAQKGNFTNYLVAIGMLIMGLVMTQKLGVAGGSLAGGAYANLKKLGTAVPNWTGSTLKKVGIAGTKWTGRRLDDSQASVQRALLATRLGQRAAGSAFGRSIGLDKVAVHGIALRTLPAAWSQRKAKIEGQRLGESSEVTHDVLNRLLSLGNNKTDYTSLGRGRRVGEIKRELESGSVEQTFLINRLINEGLDENGHARIGKEAEVEAIFEVLTKHHDINEVLKDHRISGMAAFNKGDYDHQFAATDKDGKYVPGEAGRGVYNQHNVKVLLRGVFGETEGARVGSKIQEVGLANKDAILWGMSSSLPGGGAQFNSDETQAQMTSAYINKRGVRENGQRGARQDFLQESADQNDFMHFRRTMDTANRKNLVAYTPSWIAQPTHILPETRSTLLQNLDIAMAEANDLEESDSTVNKERGALVKRALAGIVASETGQDVKVAAKDPRGIDGMISDFIETNITENEDLQADWAVIEYNRRNPNKIIGKGLEGDALRQEYKDRGKALLQDQAFVNEVNQDGKILTYQPGLQSSHGTQQATASTPVGTPATPASSSSKIKPGKTSNRTLSSQQLGGQQSAATSQTTPSTGGGAPATSTPAGQAGRQVVDAQIGELRSAIRSNQGVVEALNKINETLDNRLHDLQMNDPNNALIQDILEAQDAVNRYRPAEGASTNVTADLTSERAEQDIISILEDIYY